MVRGFFVRLKYRVQTHAAFGKDGEHFQTT
jgi:hypothetical protein